MAQDKTIEAVLTLMAGGGILIYQGLKGSKLHRRMRDTPTSKIASAAIGKNVEVVGNVVCDLEDVIETPLSKRKGYAFVWILEELVRRNKKSEWVTRYQYYSTPYIYLRDSSNGMAAVDIAACEFATDIFDHTTKFCDRHFDLPEGVRHILDVANMLDTTKKAGFLTKSEYRIREKVFKPNERFYVFGTAHLPPKEERSHIKLRHLRFGGKKYKLTDRFKTLFHKFKSDSKLVDQYDLNKNGFLDPEENEALNRAIEEKILKAYSQNKGASYLSEARMLFSQDTNGESGIDLNMVFISNKSEKKTLSRLSMEKYFFLIGGPIMIVLGILLAIDRLSN